MSAHAKFVYICFKLSMRPRFEYSCFSTFILIKSVFASIVQEDLHFFSPSLYLHNLYILLLQKCKKRKRQRVSISS